MSEQNKITEENHPINFIRNIIEEDRRNNKWGGRIETRFPPEPNGFLHLGHAKSICLNFGLAQQFSGTCHLRFDDTNPEKEEQIYVDSIIEAVQWLGYDWGKHLYFASDYFEIMHQAAITLIKSGKAYVDSLSAEQIRQYRGTLTSPGVDSPYRNRSVSENLELFQQMQDGVFDEGAHVLRAKIDMQSPNINLRDPAIYRIRKVDHHRKGSRWCIYPLYTFAHPIEDAIEGITHSICTLEFADQRPFYDWLLNALADADIFTRPLPQQIEFSRLNLTYTVLSKRKLLQLVEQQHVQAWDDPRMPTLAGVRRRGYSAAGIRNFIEQIGVSKSDSWIDIGILEESIRQDLNETAQRRIAILRPLKLIITNYPEQQEEFCEAPNHPHHVDLGKRKILFGRELWIDQSDFMSTPIKGFRRLYPDNTVRLRYGYVIKCTGYEQDEQGQVTTVYAEYYPDSKSGTPGSDNYKVKGNIHWLNTKHAHPVEVRLYDRLFSQAFPGSAQETQELGEHDFLDDLNPESLQIITAYVEPALRSAKPEEVFQFEREGYFIVDRYDGQDGHPVFNRTVALKDSWGKAK